MSKQTVGDLINYLNNADLCEGMTNKEVRDLPVELLTGETNYGTILSTYVSTNDDGTKVMCIDIGE